MEVGKSAVQGQLQLHSEFSVILSYLGPGPIRNETTIPNQKVLVWKEMSSGQAEKEGNWVEMWRGGKGRRGKEKGGEGI